jgi:hypothetical protein
MASSMSVKFAEPVEVLERRHHGFERVKLVGGRKAPGWRTTIRWMVEYVGSLAGDGRYVSQASGLLFEASADPAVVEEVGREIGEAVAEYEAAQRRYKGRIDAALSRLARVPYQYEEAVAWAAERGATVPKGKERQ